MSWNGAGSFNRLYSWVADKGAGLNISSARMDADSNDIAANGFGNCLTRDGQGQATANLPMANFRHTGVGNGVAATDYAALGQVQNGLASWIVAGGTSDAITAIYSPAIIGLVDGQWATFRATAANATTTPTFSPNGLAARPITRAGGSLLQLGDIPGNLAEAILRYNSVNMRWELLNPAQTIPAGTELHYAGIVPPAGFYFPTGQPLSRTGDAGLFNALSFAILGNTFSNTIVALPLDLRGIGLEGSILEGSGIPAATTIVAFTATSCTLSQNATATATSVPLRFFPFGNGDGSTTFNLPDRRGRALFGRDNMNGTAAGRLTNNSFGAQGIAGSQLVGAGGEQSHTQIAQEMAIHTHTDTHNHGITEPNSGQGHGHPVTTTGGSGTGGIFAGGAGGGSSAATGLSVTGIGINNASGFLGNAGGQAGVTQAMNNVPPGGISNIIIKR
jgi:hypothetical protein